MQLVQGSFVPFRGREERWRLSPKIPYMSRIRGALHLSRDLRGCSFAALLELRGERTGSERVKDGGGWLGRGWQGERGSASLGCDLHGRDVERKSSCRTATLTAATASAEFVKHDESLVL